MNAQPGWERIPPSAASTLPRAPMPDTARAYELKYAKGPTAAVFEYDNPEAWPEAKPGATPASTLAVVCAANLSTVEEDALVEFLAGAGLSAVVLATSDAKHEYQFQWLAGGPQRIAPGPAVGEAEGHLSARSAWFEARRGAKPRSR